MPVRLKQFKLYDAPTRYIFEASKKDSAHVVDLVEHEFIGECSCEHFQMKLLPVLRDATRADRDANPNKHRCKHIIAVREGVTNIFIAALDATNELE